MPDIKEQGQDGPTQNWAGATVQLVREAKSTLGPKAPWILIFLILGFGIYKFEELRSSTQKEVQTHLLQLLSADRP